MSIRPLRIPFLAVGLFAPALLATWIGPRLTRRLLRKARVPRRSFGALFIKALLCLLFAWGWTRWIAFVCARGKDLWKD